MDTIRGEDAHKRQGTDDGILCTQTLECDRTRGVSLLGQHNHTLVRKEIRGNYFPRTARNNRENLVTLPEDQYPTSSDLCQSVLNPADATSRLTAQTEWSLSQETFESLNSIHGPHDLVHRKPSSGTELISVQMDGVQQPLCMPDLESDSANRAEGAQETNNDDFSYANVEISHMVPGSDVPLCAPAYNTASNNSSARSQKRKVSSLGKQAL
ncbi:hypothetical protein AYI69_g4994 [Smittium culicis]|uniref:Uncharacterized protein n=1 Tax=Smittium culicis TaxID=133412 RepID=A0A1R1Y947_9FUNG|nr:hypothetical protein AYI69_g4994 [Smittium culicis]